MLLKRSVSPGANILCANCQQERGRYQACYNKGRNFPKPPAILQFWIITKWNNVGESIQKTAAFFLK